MKQLLTKPQSNVFLKLVYCSSGTGTYHLLSEDNSLIMLPEKETQSKFWQPATISSWSSIDDLAQDAGACGNSFGITRSFMDTKFTVLIEFKGIHQLGNQYPEYFI